MICGILKKVDQKIVDRAVETTDWRSSLVELETYIED